MTPWWKSPILREVNAARLKIPSSFFGEHSQNLPLPIFICSSYFRRRQEPIIRSVQLPHIPVTAFLQTVLLLVWIYREFRPFTKGLKEDSRISFPDPLFTFHIIIVFKNCNGLYSTFDKRQTRRGIYWGGFILFYQIISCTKREHFLTRTGEPYGTSYPPNIFQRARNLSVEEGWGEKQTQFPS